MRAGALSGLSGLVGLMTRRSRVRILSRYQPRARGVRGDFGGAAKAVEPRRAAPLLLGLR